MLTSAISVNSLYHLALHAHVYTHFLTLIAACQLYSDRLCVRTSMSTVAIGKYTASTKA